ncbi:MAG: DNA topoisomerase IB [Microcoleaceae cyanobacterium]
MSDSQAIKIDPEQSARLAGLRYVTDEMPGIRRKKWGRGFSYFDIAGDRIGDRTVIQRIKVLAIPPSWEGVWICPLPNGHLQATGRDAKARKQYRYHAEWRSIRSQAKFNRLIDFGQVLPEIRRQVDQDLRRRKLGREKVVATVIRLLDTTHIRIGNPEYARENNSFGLTTLRNRHVSIFGTELLFTFQGKSGVQQEKALTDRRLARVIQQCQEIPGYELFQYYDEVGQKQTVNSEDVNAYLQAVTGKDFTAKDFRTWGGTVEATKALIALGSAESETQAKKNVVAAVKQAAEKLGNRAATCRKYYVHPQILQSYQADQLIATWQYLEVAEASNSQLSLELIEQKLIAFLEESS